MKALYPPLSDPAELPTRVLCFAPHADDEVFGCGGMLAFHAARGDDIRVVVMTDGAAGDPNETEADICAARRRESERAGEELGQGRIEHRFLGLPDGGLSGCATLVEVMIRESNDFAPELVYAPGPQEMHPDHRATSHAVIAALACGPERRVFLYGVNAQVTAGIVFDITRFWKFKAAAIRCFESQLRYHDLITKADAVDRSRTVNIEDAAVEYVEGFADLSSNDLLRYEGQVAALLDSIAGTGHGLESTNSGVEQTPFVAAPGAQVSRVRPDLPATTAVICTWNKAEELRPNLQALRAQTLPFEAIIVVDNASSDDTQRMVAEEFPEVNLIAMPHSNYGACETFNIGFASAATPNIAILDDDIVLPPEWLEKTSERLALEPESTAVLSTKIVEPGIPEAFLNAESVNRERYMSTFRGCGSLARRAAIMQAGGYDERLYIYGNERDLTCRLLNLGFRVLQYPDVETFHRQPFGIQMGKRSLYFHARNAWLGMLKYAPLEDLMRMPFLVLTKVLLRGDGKEDKGEVTDATGTIGIGRSLKETPGAGWILMKALGSVIYNIPYCLARREPCTHEDFELPLS
ncbi:MAG: LmbE family N-acetylglucosaminyl deacetylase/GT2 family glycosyltransferase [Planctomycetota bacterium]